MYATNSAQGLQVEQQHQHWIRVLVWAGCLVLLALVMMNPAFATGTGTGGSAAAKARILSVAAGWQEIIMGIGAAVLIIAWSIIAYQIAFNGKTLKDLQAPAIGSTVAGLAPVLVGWMYS